MFLSIIIPVYNAEKYIAECLDSCLEQDIGRDEYEIICVNDGSKDESPAILRQYAEKYENIVVHDQKNGGVCAARNAGLTLAKGDYIWFVDADDLIQPNILSTLKQLTEGKRPDRLCVQDYSFEVLSEEELKQRSENALNPNTFTFDNSACDSLMSHEYLLDHDISFRYTDIAYYEDNIFMFEFKLHEPVTETYDKVCYYYRQNPQSAMHKTSPESAEKRYWSFRRGAEVTMPYWKQGTSDRRDTANIIMTFIWSALFMIADMPFLRAIRELKGMRREGLFPIKRLEACSLKRSYQTTRTDAVGKAFDCIFIHMNRRWGFWAMFLLKRAQKVKYRIKGLS